MSSKQPIAIRDLKRFATDHGSPWQRNVKPAPHQHAEKVAIIGAGPTGLSAAYYLARRGYPITVFDAMPVAGGMMAIGIPDYRLPRVELNRDIDAIRSLGVELRLNTAIGRDISLIELQEQYDAVLIAVGAQRSQRLGVPGEDMHGVIPATTFLKQFNLVPETKHRLAKWRWSAVAARHWMRRVRRCEPGPLRSTFSTGAPEARCRRRRKRCGPPWRKASNSTSWSLR